MPGTWQGGGIRLSKAQCMADTGERGHVETIAEQDHASQACTGKGCCTLDQIVPGLAAPVLLAAGSKCVDQIHTPSHRCQQPRWRPPVRKWPLSQCWRRRPGPWCHAISRLRLPATSGTQQQPHCASAWLSGPGHQPRRGPCGQRGPVRGAEAATGVHAFRTQQR